MKVVAINGSPHKEGNTALALNVLRDELARFDIETEIIHIGNRPVHGCMACGVCAKRRDLTCAIDDCVNEVLPRMVEADAIVLGSPVYYSGIAGTMKCFLDRAFYTASASGGKFAGKVGAAVVAVRRAGASATFAGLNYYLQISQMLMPGSSYWNMVHGRAPGEAECDDEGTQTIRHLARNIAWLLKMKAHAEGVIPAPEYEKVVRTQISDRLKK